MAELLPRTLTYSLYPTRSGFPFQPGTRRSIARRLCFTILARTEDLQCWSRTRFNSDVDRWTRRWQPISNGCQRSHTVLDRNCPRLERPKWTEITSSQYPYTYPIIIGPKPDTTINSKSIAPYRSSRRRGTSKWRIRTYTPSTGYRCASLDDRRRRLYIRWSRFKRKSSRSQHVRVVCHWK
jgi:hypothetical protein